MNEIWKDVEGYEGLYQVSNYGNVRCTNWNHTGTTRQLTPFYQQGYKRIGFRRNFKLKNHMVHRLVASAFIPNPQRKPVVNHIDGNKSNNHVSNLEWATFSENTRHAIAHNLRPVICEQNREKGEDNCHCKRIQQLTITGEPVAEWKSALTASLATGAKVMSIQRCCRGERKTHHGYQWRYIKRSKSHFSNPQ